MGWNKDKTVFTLDGEGAHTGLNDNPYGVLKKEEEEDLVEGNIDFLFKKYNVSLPAKYSAHLTQGLQHISKVLGRNRELVNRWLELFRGFVDRGSAIPQERAWIAFHEEYVAQESGGWARR